MVQLFIMSLVPCFLQLTATEDARRVGDLDTVYMTQRRLAQYFEQSRDTWLSDHFYQRCLETGVQIRGDGRRKEGEAHCHVGLALEKRGKQMADRSIELALLTWKVKVDCSPLIYCVTGSWGLNCSIPLLLQTCPKSKSLPDSLPNLAVMETYTIWWEISQV